MTEDRRPGRVRRERDGERASRRVYATCPRCSLIVPGYKNNYGPDPIPQRHDCEPRETPCEHDWRLYDSRWQCVRCNVNTDGKA